MNINPICWISNLLETRKIRNRLLQCRNGEHEPEEILENISFTFPPTHKKIMWCKICGTVVIDKKIGDELIPGGIMPEKIPEIIGVFKQK